MQSKLRIELLLKFDDLFEERQGRLCERIAQSQFYSSINPFVVFEKSLGLRFHFARSEIARGSYSRQGLFELFKTGLCRATNSWSGLRALVSQPAIASALARPWPEVP